MAEILGRAEDGDGVGGLGLILTGDGVDLVVDPAEPDGGDQQDDAEEAAEKAATAHWAAAAALSSRGSGAGSRWRDRASHLGETPVYGRTTRGTLKAHPDGMRVGREASSLHEQTAGLRL